MTDVVKVEMKDRDDGDQEIWGEGELKPAERKVRFNARSIVWFLAPMFLIMPLVTYLRNKEEKLDATIDLTPPPARSEQQPISVPEVSQQRAGVKRNSPKTATTYSALNVIGLNEKKTLPPGSQVKALLITGASNGPVKAKTLESLIIDGDTILESGVTLIGRGQSTEDRLFVMFNKIVWPDGRFQPTVAQAYDMSDMIAGLKGSKVHSHVMQFAAGAGLNFIGGVSEGLQETETVGGLPVRSNTFRNAALNGAATAALEQGRSILESTKNQAPLIEVPKDSTVWIIFGGDN